MSSSDREKSTGGFKTSSEESIPMETTVQPIDLETDQILEDIGDSSVTQQESVLELSRPQLLLTSAVPLTELEFPITKQEEQNTGIIPKLAELSGKALLESDQVEDRKVSSPFLKIEEKPILFTKATNILEEKLMTQNIAEPQNDEVEESESQKTANEELKDDKKDEDERLTKTDVHEGFSMKPLGKVVDSSFTQTTKTVHDELCMDKPSTSAVENIDNIGERKTGKKAKIRLLPFKVPENIIIVLDRAKDDNVSVIKETEIAPLNFMKQALKMFLQCNSSQNTNHRYGLITMDSNSSTLVHNLSNNIESLINTLNAIDECSAEPTFDLNTVFDLILKNVQISEPKNSYIPPRYIVRVVFMYARSLTIPTVKMTPELSNLMNSPCFIFDVAMTLDGTVNREKIIKYLASFNEKSFFLTVGGNVPDFQAAMVKLLGHPLQRRPQELLQAQQLNFHFNM